MIFQGDLPELVVMTVRPATQLKEECITSIEEVYKLTGEALPRLVKSYLDNFRLPAFQVRQSFLRIRVGAFWWGLNSPREAER